MNPALAGTAPSGGSYGGGPAPVASPFPAAMPLVPTAGPVAPPPTGFQPAPAGPVGPVTAAMGGMSLGAAPTMAVPPAVAPGYATPGSAPAAYPTALSQASMMINPAYQCPKEWMRTTLNAIPQSTELANKSQVPFGVIVHPLAEVPDKEVRFQPAAFSFPPFLIFTASVLRFAYSPHETICLCQLPFAHRKSF